MLAEEQRAHNCSNTMTFVFVQMCSLSSVNKQSYEFDTPIHQHLHKKNLIFIRIIKASYDMKNEKLRVYMIPLIEEARENIDRRT